MSLDKMDLSLDDIIMKDRKRGDAVRKKTMGKPGPTRQTMAIKGKSFASKPAAASKVIPRFKLINDRAKKTVSNGKGGMIGAGAVVKPHAVRISKAKDLTSKQITFQRKVRLDSRKGPVVTTIVEKAKASASMNSIKITNSLSREIKSPRETERIRKKENFEIHISNDRAAAMDSNRVYEPVDQASYYQRAPLPIQAQAQLMPPTMVPAGISSASSAFRTPMAVMDMYTGRYGRPTMEPYRPPPAVQQFYSALNSNNSSTTLLNPSHLNTQVQQRTAFTPAQSFNVLSDRFSDNQGQIRKPYE